MSTQLTPALSDATLQLEGGVALVTFNRHDIRNALTGSQLIDDILKVIDWANQDSRVAVLVFTGAGSAFSAGGNIKEMQHRDTTHKDGAFSGDVYQVQEKYRRGIQQIPLAMEKTEVPTIAAINGPAIGAGFDFACMCDIRIGSDNARMGETFVNLGIIPGDGGAWFLQRLIGYQRAAELTFTGRVIDASEARSLGILLEVVSPEALLEHTLSIAAQMAAKPPQALRLTKRLMKSAQRLELPDFLDQCALFQGICHNTEDHLEAVSAFIEKRPGDFNGR
ncbi:enoyl-CoA hydratase-related protein [Marinobacterium jannaschii]|uniref:enoyl-CoA hydratase-related protein n=1 Tax=Marinobacterium jannaschii TaxID=64970 RepID=UPI0004887C78|nr:enoyl-CoA hydratase-related protein [Marinobacterium jannaschii]